MSKAIIEILQEINQTPEALERFTSSMLLRMTFEYAFDPRNKFVLPDGVPPYTPDSCPLGTNPTNFNNEIRRLYIFTPQKQLDTFRRETLFIQLLETIHPSEAELLLAIKDQTLHKLFPNITPELVHSYGMISTQILELWTAQHHTDKNLVIETNDTVETQSTPEVVNKKKSTRGRKPKTIVEN